MFKPYTDNGIAANVQKAFKQPLIFGTVYPIYQETKENYQVTCHIQCQSEVKGLENFRVNLVLKGSSDIDLLLNDTPMSTDEFDRQTSSLRNKSIWVINIRTEDKLITYHGILMYCMVSHSVACFLRREEEGDSDAGWIAERKAAEEARNETFQSIPDIMTMFHHQYVEEPLPCYKKYLPEVCVDFWN
jgi:hypothetical protein